MLTSLKLALAAAAAAATGGYAMHGAIGEDQQPQTQDSYTWKLASQETPAPQDSRMDKKVSVQLDGTVSDVAKWLSDQGVSFVIADSELGQKKITLNMVDQPLKDVVQAIGDALGGHWSKRGNVFSFQRGNSMLFGDMKELPEGMQSFKWDAKDLPNLEGLKELKNLKDFRVAIPKMDGKEFKMLLPPMDFKNFKFDNEKLTDAQKKEVEKAMKEAGEAMKKAFDGKTFIFDGQHNMSDAERREFEKSMKDAFDSKEWKELKDLKGHQWKISDAEKKEIEKSLKDAKIEMDRAMKSGKLDNMKWKSMPLDKWSNFDELGLGSADLGKLAKSLTPAQRAKQKKQGYLTPADLSASQRAMLGSMRNSGNWTISFSQNGDKITLKNK